VKLTPKERTHWEERLVTNARAPDQTPELRENFKGDRNLYTRRRTHRSHQHARRSIDIKGNGAGEKRDVAEGGMDKGETQHNKESLVRMRGTENKYIGRPSSKLSLS